jgi:hypothetical protein
MSAKIESHGDIEVICSTHDLAPNKTARLIFRTVDLPSPPYQIRIKSPTGKIILERVIRELPTGAPQSPPPVQFTVQKGDYEIHVAQIKGGAEGTAILSVS